MAKVKVKNEKSLKEAKEKLRGTIDLRKTKCGVIAAGAKWPKKKRNKILNMKNLFSERYKYKKLENLKIDEMPISLRNRLWNVIKDEFFDCPWIDRDKTIEVIWDEFFKEDKDNLKGVETYI